MKRYLYGAAILLGLIAGLATPLARAQDEPYRDPSLPVEERVEDLLARMTLEEKIGQMTLVEKNSIIPGDITALGIGGLLSGGGGYPDPNTPEAWAQMVDGFQEYALDSRLGIPLIYGVDAVHGHNNVRGATIFPHQIGLGAANDTDLMERIGQATAEEMVATGIYWNYAPVLAVPQDIRWGRTYEGYGQDTELVSRLGVAYLRGMQSNDLAVIGTPKHYIGDGATVWGSSTRFIIDQGVMTADEETIRARYLPPYQAAIDAGARSIMISFSSWNATKMHAEKYLVTDVLKDELGFTGFVVSDWGGIDQISPNYFVAVITAINAGIDMNMVPYDYRLFVAVMLHAVDTGAITEDRIDDAVRRILRVKFEMGLFEHPFSDPDLLSTVGSDEHRALAREAVARSQVLLKNDGDLLPLAVDTPLILVAGNAAKNIGIQCGGWTINWQGGLGDITPGTTILQGIQNTVSDAAHVVYTPTGRFAERSERAPVCIAVVGELPYAEGLGDNPDLTLFPEDLEMLANLRDRCDQVVMVVVSGRPLIITDLVDEVDALVAAWLPGTEGQGVADVLFGLQPFTGKLSYEWPRSVDQLPLGSSDTEPRFPIGFGLETAVIQADQ
jgi:beta-glucosidase